MNLPYRFDLSAVVTEDPAIVREVTQDGRVTYTVTLVSDEVTLKAADDVIPAPE